MSRRSLFHGMAPLVVAAALAAQACDPADQGDAGGVASPDSAAAASLDRAEQAAKQLATTLRQRLTEAMGQGGPAQAITVCATEAQQIAAKVREESGVQVGRSSLRLRTPADAAPDWVAEWLKQQGERKAEGVSGVRAAADTPQGKRARVILPIAVEAACLNCHGDPAQIAPEVMEVLQQQYPEDKATGYAIGDLRGALWAEAPVE